MLYLVSGFFYVLVFSFTIFCFYKVDRLYWKYSIVKVSTKRWFALGILIPCLVAGLREYDVGIDTKAIVNLLEYSYTYGSFDFLLQAVGGITESIYAVIVYLISRVTSNGGVLLFVLQFMTIIPIAIAAVKLRKYVPIHMVMATYLFCFFNNSLNIMRQSVTCAFFILCIAIITNKEEKCYAKALLLMLFSLMFHKSAIIGCLLLVVCYIIAKMNTRKVLQIVLYISIVFLPLMLSKIVETLDNLGILSDSFKGYTEIFLYRTVNKEYFLNPFSIYAICDLFLRLMLLCIPLCVVRKDKKSQFNFKFLQLSTVAGFLIFSVILFSMNTNYGQRISLFLDMFLVLLIPYSLWNSRIKQKRIIFYGILFLYWVIWIMYYGWSGSNIYEFVF